MALANVLSAGDALVQGMAIRVPVHVTGQGAGQGAGPDHRRGCVAGAPCGIDIHSPESGRFPRSGNRWRFDKGSVAPNGRYRRER